MDPFSKRSFFTKKILSSILVVTILVPSIFFAIPPKKADAFWVFDAANFVKNSLSAIFEGTTAVSSATTAGGTLAHNVKIFLLDGIATAMARLMIQKITAQTVNWINNGFQGNPAFVTNPDQLLLDTADQVFSKQLVKGGALEKLCGPFRAQVRLAIVKTYLAEDDPNRLTCTFGAIGDNIQKIGTDFASGGGWDAFFKISQESRNNPWGAYTIAQSDIAASIQVAQKNIEKDREVGYGFLSFKRCPKGYTNAELANKVSDDSLEGLSQAQSNAIRNVAQDPKGCATNPEIVTPGSVIAGQLQNVLGSPVKQLELTDSINQIVNALMVQMVNRLFSSISGGLRGLGEKQSTDRVSLADQLNTNSPESKQEEQKILENTNKSIPSNLGVSIDPNTGQTISTNPPSLLPPINEEDVKANAKKEILEYQAEYDCPVGQTCTTTTITPPPTNNPGGTARGDIATTTDTGGRTGGR